MDCIELLERVRNLGSRPKGWQCKSCPAIEIEILRLTGIFWYVPPKNDFAFSPLISMNRSSTGEQRIVTTAVTIDGKPAGTFGRPGSFFLIARNSSVISPLLQTWT